MSQRLVFRWIATEIWTRYKLLGSFEALYSLLWATLCDYSRLLTSIYDSVRSKRGKITLWT